MTVAPTRHSLPMVLTEIEVVDVQRLSPTFVRVAFGSPALADFGVDGGPLLDQRIKLVFPDVPGVLPRFDGADESWYSTWLARPVRERGHMRTFSVRRFVDAGRDSRLEVDFAVHESGECGPAARWAASARRGDRLILLGPARGVAYGGIEFTPGDATDIVLAGDETAVPAISAIVEDGLTGRRAVAFLEVPTAADVLDLAVPGGVTVTWLPRADRPRGHLLRAAVADHLGVASEQHRTDEEPVVQTQGNGADLPWETPTYSASGEPVAAAQKPVDGLYAWVAGESSVVTAIRRHLVQQVGLDRSQVAFMGYWREGVAMRS